MSFDIQRCPRLLTGRTYSEEAWELLGIVEVGKPSGRKDQCRSECNSDPFDGRQGFESLVELRGCDVSRFRFELFDLPCQEVDGLVQCPQTGFVLIRQDSERSTQVL